MDKFMGILLAKINEQNNFKIKQILFFFFFNQCYLTDALGVQPCDIRLWCLLMDIHSFHLSWGNSKNLQAQLLKILDYSQ